MIVITHSTFGWESSASDWRVILFTAASSWEVIFSTLQLTLHIRYSRPAPFLDLYIAVFQNYYFGSSSALRCSFLVCSHCSVLIHKRPHMPVWCSSYIWYSLLLLLLVVLLLLLLLWRCNPTQVMASSFLRFLDHTRHTTVGRTPLDEWSARRRDLYLRAHNIHSRQISMLRVGFEPTISAGERPQTYALDCAATGTGKCDTVWYRI